VLTLIQVDWLKVILLTSVVQLLFFPLLWKDVIHLKKLVLKIYRVAFIFLLSISFLILVKMLHYTDKEGFIVAMLCGVGVVIQSMVLYIFYYRKK
jgi:hypothetical protein